METGEDDGIGKGSLSEQRAVDVEGDAGQELENGAGWQGEVAPGLTRSWNWTVYEKLGSGKARVVSRRRSCSAAHHWWNSLSRGSVVEEGGLGDGNAEEGDRDVIAGKRIVEQGHLERDDLSGVFDDNADASVVGDQGIGDCEAGLLEAGGRERA